MRSGPLLGSGLMEGVAIVDCFRLLPDITGVAARLLNSSSWRP